MKQKIQRIITSCNECDHSMLFESEFTKALICTGIEINEEESSEPFLIIMDSHPKHYKNDIPVNCPLEDYEGRN